MNTTIPLSFPDIMKQIALYLRQQLAQTGGKNIVFIQTWPIISPMMSPTTHVTSAVVPFPRITGLLLKNELQNNLAQWTAKH